MVGKIANALGVSPNPGSFEGMTIGILGLAFKPNTDDVRDAPSITIIRELKQRGARVQAFDPAAMGQAEQFLTDVDYRLDPYDAARGADALVLLTEWNEFRNLDMDRIKTLMRRSLFLDLRNVYEPDKVKALGFDYHGVGRG
jgi:UDPglucose 6-dehydrogenase